MATRRVDLNADLGEGGGHDHELLIVVTSASVACGFHAGDPGSMVDTARAAARTGVAVGAHPSYPDREGFGRRDMDMAPDLVAAAVAYQVGAMATAAAYAGSRMAYVKPHGALYNRAAVDRAVAEAVVEGIAKAARALHGEPPGVLAPAGSTLMACSEAAGLRAHAEGFADRAYRRDGTLVGRSEPGAVLDRPDAVVAQALDLVLRGRAGPAEGLRVDSLCVHGDTPGAVALARSIRAALEEAGVTIRPFADP